MENNDNLEKLELSLRIASVFFTGNRNDQLAVDYMAKRGIDQATAKRFGIGYAPDSWRGLVEHYTSKYMRSFAVTNGLIGESDSGRQYDFFRDRLMFPIRNVKGVTVGYGGRRISNDDMQAKYLNSPETPLFSKSELLYGLHENRADIASTGAAIVVEGYMDVVALYQAGITNAVASMGTALSGEQISTLQHEGASTVYLCLDGDKSGQRAMGRLLEDLVQTYNSNTDIRLVTLPVEHDPDSYIKSHGVEAFNKQLASSMSLDNALMGVTAQKLPRLNAFSIKEIHDTGVLAKLSIEERAHLISGYETILENCVNTPLQQKMLAALSQIVDVKVGDLYGGRFTPESHSLSTVEFAVARILCNHKDSQRSVMVRSALEAIDNSTETVKRLLALNDNTGCPNLKEAVTIAGALTAHEAAALQDDITKFVYIQRLEAELGQAEKCNNSFELKQLLMMG